VAGDVILKAKGAEDGYSGFSVTDLPTGERRETGLEQFLRDRGVDHVVIAGLTTDYCVKETALDAVRKGFDTDVIVGATRPVDVAALDYLGSLDLFDESFLSMLSELRFTGEVRAIPEGELVFPNEPIVQVTAPLVEAQLVETFLLNCIGYQTMIATKAARVATACGDHTFVDFSPRRDHGTDAALKTARAAYVGGAAATSLVLGGQVYGLELSGTMAH